MSNIKPINLVIACSVVVLGFLFGAVGHVPVQILFTALGLIIVIAND